MSKAGGWALVLVLAGALGPSATEGADGLKMSDVPIETKEPVSRATLPWWPWHGNGRYRLRAFAKPLEATSHPASAAATVEVVGIPPDVVNPENHVIALLRRGTGAPALWGAPVTRFTSPDPRASRWVGTAWVGREMVRAYLYDDGREEVIRRPVGFDPGDYSVYWQPVTRPAGTYRMLMALFDDGSLAIDRAAALAAVAHAADETNRGFAEASREAGAPGPILRLEVTAAYARTARDPAGFVVRNARVKALTGQDPARFDLHAQVDLAKVPHPAVRGGAGGWSLRGYTGRGPESANLWVHVDDPARLPTALRFTLLDHEFSHSCGWEHEWPVGTGGGPENTDYAAVWPRLLLGWTDRDGDGKVEILDPTPYGIPEGGAHPPPWR